MASATTRVDFIVFGASGFTGQYVVQELVRWLQDGDTFTFAVAGRSEEKLRNVLKQVKDVIGVDMSDKVEIVIADVNNADSLTAMCQKAKVVLNCVGPYRFFGEPVVSACLENGAHYIDISGEPQFLESMQLKYDSTARDKKLFVISSCGFDSIPCDLGVLFTEKQFAGDVNDIDSFLSLHTGQQGVTGHYATYQSAIHGFANANELRSIRKSLFKEKMPRFAHRQKPRGSAFYSDEVSGWCIPFLGSDKSVVKRTQYYLFTEHHRRPVQYSPYAKVGSLCSLVLMMLFGGIFSLLAKCSWGRSLLEKYPRLFTFGLFTHDGPSVEQMRETSFSMLFLATGYEDKVDDPMLEHEGKPDVKKRCLVQGPEPGYVATPICMLAAAVTILKDTSNLPHSGGVLTPGAAFHKSDMIFELLNKHGVKFSTINDV